MAYRKDFTNAARRHLRAATELNLVASAGSQPGCNVVAGYLFGLSGELALKAIMRESGMTPLSATSRREDPFYAHFPEIKSLLRNTLKGRRAGELRKYAESPTLFANWDTNMRYAPTSDIQHTWIITWQQNARELIELMDIV